MNNLLLFIAALLVLALSALFAAPWFVDWNDYRGVFEKQASRLVGREVNVGGDVSLKFLPAPVLRFENINVADERGSFDTPFMSARSFTVWLSVPPLLRGVIEARDVALDQPLLNLTIGADGEGNWRDVGRPDVVLPFMPRDVALESLRILDATVTLAKGDSEPYLTLDHLDGELSARSLRGPYKFAGSFEANGERSELRFSTARTNAGEDIRLKAVLTRDGGRAAYQIDGGVSGFDGVPRFNGDFIAEFADGEDALPKDGNPLAEAVPEGAPLQVKATVDAGLQEARLTDIEATIRRSNKPQTISGEIDLTYGMRTTVAGALTSRWVDLDTLARAASDEASEPATPQETAAGIARHILLLAKAVEELSLDVTLDQAVLSGDLLHEVRATVIGGGGKATIKKLSARLPGEAQISISGALKANNGIPGFAGAVDLSGEKLNRLLGWAGIETGTSVASQDGAFSLNGALSVAPDAIALESATGRLFGSHFSGALRYSSGEKRRFDLTLKSDRLDIGRIGGDWVKAITIPALFRNRTGPEGRTPADFLNGAEAQLDIEIGSVTLPDMGNSALSAGVHIAGGDVDIRKLQIRSDNGLKLDASGSLAGLDKMPTGSISLTADAQNESSVRVLARLLGLGEAFSGQTARVGALAPARIKATIRSSGRGGKAGLAGKLDGTLAGSELAISAELGGSLAEWKTSPLSIAAEANNADGKALLAQLFPASPPAGLESLAKGPGKVSLRADGKSASAMKVDIALKAAATEWTASGTASIAAEPMTFNGKSEAVLPDADLLLQFAGTSSAPGRAPQPLKISGDVKASGDVYEISKISGRIAKEAFSGSTRLDWSGDRPSLTLDLSAGTASLPAILQPLIAWDADMEPDTVRGVSTTEAYWPDQKIDAELLASFDGDFKLRAKEMLLAGNLLMKEARVNAGVKDGVLTFEKIEGEMLGGTFSGEARLEVQPGGLAFSAGAGARALRLERINDDRLAKGSVDLELEVEGQGVSPRGLAASLSGKGLLTFSEGKISKLAPQTPKKAAAGLAETRQSDNAKLLSAIRRNLASGSFSFKPFEARIAIRNGVARAEKVDLQDPSGTAVVTTFLELATLKLDSEWELVSGKATDEAAPRISLAFAGPLAEIGQLEPQIDAGALQRHLTIQRMERDVERLENLEVPGAPKRKSEDKRTTSGTAGQERPRSAAIPVSPPTPKPRPAPPVQAAPVTPAPPVVDRQPRPAPPVQAAPATPAAPNANAPQSNESVVSRPLPPAAPPGQQQPTPAQPALPQTPEPSPLPWLGQQQQPPQQLVQPPQTEAYRPPAAIPETPAPQPAWQPPPREPEPEPWNPFQQEGL